MVRIARAVIFYIIIVCTGTTWSQGRTEKPPPLGEDATLEYQVKRQLIEERIADFYTRLILLEREDRERQRGAEEKRKERQKQAAEYEKARLEFIKERKVKTPPDPSQWEKELAERRERYERARKDYVRRRDELERFEKSIGGIPEEIEYGLEEVYQ